MPDILIEKEIPTVDQNLNTSNENLQTCEEASEMDDQNLNTPSKLLADINNRGSIKFSLIHCSSHDVSFHLATQTEPCPWLEEVRQIRQKILDVKTKYDNEKPIWMSDRRPKQETENVKPSDKISYFSEIIAADNLSESTQMKVPDVIREWVESRIYFQDCLGNIQSLRYSLDGSVLAVAYSFGTIELREGISGHLIAILRTSYEGASAATCIVFHPTMPDLFYVSCADGDIFQCSISAMELDTFSSEKNNEVNTIDINSTGLEMASGGKDAAIRIYDMETKEVISVYGKTADSESHMDNQEFHTMRLFSLKFDPDNPNILVSGGWDGCIKVWDIRSENPCVRNIYGPRICGEALDITKSQLLVGSSVACNGLMVYDLGTAQLLQTVVPTNRSDSSMTSGGEFPYTAQFYRSSERVLYGGAGIGGLEIINVKDNLVTHKFPEAKPVITAHWRQNSIAFAGISNCLHVNYMEGGSFVEPTLVEIADDQFLSELPSEQPIQT